MAKVEVDEVLGLCLRVSRDVLDEGEILTVPWVTKLPKFLPTIQCHVAPFRSSNCCNQCMDLERIGIVDVIVPSA